MVSSVSFLPPPPPYVEELPLGPPPAYTDLDVAGPAETPGGQSAQPSAPDLALFEPPRKSIEPSAPPAADVVGPAETPGGQGAQPSAPDLALFDHPPKSIEPSAPPAADVAEPEEIAALLGARAGNEADPLRAREQAFKDAISFFDSLPNIADVDLRDSSSVANYLLARYKNRFDLRDRFGAIEKTIEKKLNDPRWVYSCLFRNEPIFGDPLPPIPEIVLFAGEEVLSDAKVMRMAIGLEPRLLEMVRGGRLIDSPEEVEEILKLANKRVREARGRVWGRSSLVETDNLPLISDLLIRVAMRKNPANLRFWPLNRPGLSFDIRQAIQSVSLDGALLVRLSEELQQTIDVVEAAVRQNGDVLQLANDRFREDLNIVRLAIQTGKRGIAFSLAHPILRSNRNIALLAIEYNYEMLVYASPELRDEEALCRLAVVNLVHSRANAALASLRGYPTRTKDRFLPLLRESTGSIDSLVRRLGVSERLQEKMVEIAQKRIKEIQENELLEPGFEYNARCAADWRNASLLNVSERGLVDSVKAGIALISSSLLLGRCSFV